VGAGAYLLRDPPFPNIVAHTGSRESPSMIHPSPVPLAHAHTPQSTQEEPQSCDRHYSASLTSFALASRDDRTELTGGADSIRVMNHGNDECAKVRHGA
jgi:hypothetical protein